MAKVSNSTKFRLLLWKNWLLQCNHKWQVATELILPALFTMLLVIFRQMIVPKHESQVVYPAHSISKLSPQLLAKFQPNVPSDRAPLLVLPYSPTNPYLDKIVKMAAESLKLTGTKGLPDSESLDRELKRVNYFAGVEFDDSFDKLNKYPDKLSFALRFPGDLRTSPGAMSYSWATSRLFPFVSGNYPRHPDQSDGGVPLGYLREGFIQLQNAISMAYIQLASNSDEKLPYIELQRFPYPSYIYDPLLEGMRNLVSVMLILSFIYPCTYITKYIAHEKEKQLKEVMKIMGMASWLHWMAWFVKAFLSLMLTSILIIELLQIRWANEVAVFTNSGFTPVLFFFMIYVIVSIAFCFMLSVFFSKASTAAAVTGLVWFMAYIPFLFMVDTYNDLTYKEKILWSLVCNTAMAFGLKIIIGFEGNGDGLQWYNMFEPVNVDDDLTLGTVMAMMLFSALIYFLICLYVEQIFPGDFGVGRKWYFPFMKSFWTGETPYPTEREDLRASLMPRRNPEAFEREPKDKFTGLQIINLKKRFGDKWAVKGLSLNMYEDEITVLLGHNGAGKTTTISMLTGMFTPTSGTAIINGYDIRKDIDGARSSLGICPQHNVLFDDMSVSNHIRFFCRLKGLRGIEVKREIEKYLLLIDIVKKAHVPSSKLSGGMQRKLSVCCALCGGTKVVLCDEPSSGMDPAARRHMWNLLQGEKMGRTLLLTTHFMDEAEVLGDRIAIMSDGELKCHGTPFFLKKKFGSGYRLICIKRDECRIDEVTALLQKFIPNIQPSTDLGAELTYQLPYDYSMIFEKMLGALEDDSERLGLNGYGITISSMEEVFLKVGAETFQEQDYMTSYDIYRDDDVESMQSNVTLGNTINMHKPNIVMNQWRAMFLKKMLYTYRKKILLVVQAFIPIYFVIMTVLISQQGLFELLPPLEVHLTNYPAAITVLEVMDDVEPGTLEYRIAKAYKLNAKSFGSSYTFESTGLSTFQEFILDLGRTKQVRINSRYLAAATVGKDYITAWLNNQPLHTAPLTVNMVHNAIARALIGPQSKIMVINKPLPQSADTQLQDLEAGNSLGGQLATNVGFAMAFITSLYILFLIKENESRAKLLQFVGGVRVWIFWFTQLAWDLFTYGITALILIVTLACFQEKYCSTFEELFNYFVLIMVFGFAALPLTYVISSYFTEPATGFARNSTINIFLGIALYLIVIIMSIPVFETKYIADELMWYFMVYPHFSLAIGINELYINTATKDLCNTESINALTDDMRCRMIPECCTIKGPFDWDRPGVLAEIVYMLIVGILCLCILIIREYRLIRDIVINFKRSMKKRPELPPEENMDLDVAREKERIKHMSKSEIAAQNLVLNRVTKYYGHFLAVNQVSLCVKPAECFGLLGVNGAGKTTTFKMLTGDEKMTYGKAYVKGYGIHKNMNAVYQEIGYCPQFDALLEDLTGREILRIFCLLRGVPKRRIRYLSDELARAFGFMKHMDKAVRKYSGGNKRKLSTAVAVLGNPAVVYLDEPTTGMDPGARRRLWNVVCLVRDSGKSIVLTSHSMEECEALCTRLAIMVNGELKCIGSIQHLKNKFSKGFILKIKIKTTMTPMDRRVASLRDSEHDGELDTVISTVLSDLIEDVYETAQEELEEVEIPMRKPEKFDVPELRKHEKDKDKKHNNNRSTYGKESMLISSAIRETYISKVKHHVELKFPLAELQEYYQGMLTFYVPLKGVKWSQIFGFMERNRETLNIEDYAITQTTLEEIFLDFAKHQIDMRTHSRKKGCSAFLRPK